ncbi:MerR family transcriptional regulator [Sphingomonas bacterium]|uniref:MerR family transcriptional regulator n=1 Tax=Sphingomonas bacterium TaxID=1895847 RepID=UPI00157524DE|nr:MerR family transcriptional regulator [Sphingomonas bacterium]
MAPPEKAEGAFWTISEVAGELGLPQHILRYWETRFPQLKPLQRAGNRRYYRPADVALVRRIQQLLAREGYTVRGVQKLLAEDDRKAVPVPALQDRDGTIKAIRDGLALALVEDARLTL